MTCIVHDRVNQWASPPSEAWQAKARRTHSEIHEVVCRGLGNEGEHWKICLAGSSLNETWTQCSSDVDLHAIRTDRFAYSLPDDEAAQARIRHELSGCNVDCEFIEQRARVEEILKRRYQGDFRSQPHSLRIAGTHTRTEVDVVFGLPHRCYRGICQYCGESICKHGVELRRRGAPDKPVVCYPELRKQAIDEYDQATGGNYRRLVRIMKCVRRAMADSSDRRLVAASERVKSCVIESVLATVPAGLFCRQTDCHWPMINRVVPHVVRRLADASGAKGLMDLGGVEPLFESRLWTREDVLRFFEVAWGCLEDHSLPLAA